MQLAAAGDWASSVTESPAPSIPRLTLIVDDELQRPELELVPDSLPGSRLHVTGIGETHLVCGHEHDIVRHNL
jgi:hypothetical protein